MCQHAHIPKSGTVKAELHGFSMQSLPTKSRPRTHLVAVLLGSIQNAVDEFAGDLVQVLIASWLLAGLASVRACD